jgi:hypothetical protein
MSTNKGKIDTALAEEFLSDHYDTFAKKTGPSIRTLCGHGEDDAEAHPDWNFTPFEPTGAVQGKVADSRMAEQMTFVAHTGHPCGTGFDAAKFLAAHPEYSWQSSVLGDMNSKPWTQFRTGERAPDPGTAEESK